MSRRSLGYLRCLLAGAWLVCSGCGPISYALEVSSAERVVSEARAQNADYFAPYELHFARAQLVKAREAAAEAAYEDALSMLETARTYGQRALERSAEPGERTR